MIRPVCCWNGGNLRALLPSGTPQDLAVELRSASLLVLDPTALGAASAGDWQAAFASQAVAWDGKVGLPPTWAVNVRDYQWVEFSTDGTDLWIQGKPGR